jgi:hypothetical protein
MAGFGSHMQVTCNTYFGNSPPAGLESKHGYFFQVEKNQGVLQ